MNVLVTGASGLIGTALAARLTAAGHIVVRAVRGRAAGAGESRWDPATGRLEPAGRPEAVVHLASESLAAGRWNPRLKRRAWSSRVDATRALCEEMAATGPPQVLLAASAIGIYGGRGDEVLDESTAPGSGFLADLVQAWEHACEPLARAGSRVVNLRMGLVLSRRGGALGSMLPPARLGLVGPLGGGRQYWSWIALDDVVEAFAHVLGHPHLAGPVNVVSPAPARQAEFARALGRALRRPAFLPAPAWALRLVLGEMADAFVLSGARVVPRRLLETGFAFRHPTLDQAIRSALTAG